MHVVVAAGDGSVDVVERDTPVVEGTSDDVEVVVTSSGICGSDLHLLDVGLRGVVLGHEFGGRTNDGRLVAVRPTGQCHACTECNRGLHHLCRNAGSSLLGISRDGGLAESVHVARERLIPMPDGVRDTDVALVEPLAVVVHGVERAQHSAGMRALVVGAGSIGLLCGAVLADRGVVVDVLARHDHQRTAARALVLTPVDEAGHDYDIAFDAVCSQSAFDTCVTALRPRGSLVEFGMFWEPVSLSNALLMKEITLLPSIFYSHDHSHDDFVTAADLLGRSPRLSEVIVTHRFALDDADRAFAAARDRAAGAIKVHLFTSL